MNLSAQRSPAFTYVVLAHDRPEAVLRLAGTILEEVPESRILIHYSASSGPFPEARDARIMLVDSPIAVRWGTFSQTEMMLRSIHEVRRRGLPDAWIVMLSGRCYPARPLDDLEQMLLTCGGDAHFWLRRIEQSDRDLLDRYTFEYRVVADRPLPFPLSTRAARGIFNRLQPFVRLKSVPRIGFVGVRRRHSIKAMVPELYFGVQWIAISRRAVDALDDALARRPELLESYRGTIAPEESFFSTVLLNESRLRVIPTDLHYIDWSTKSTGSPRSLAMNDFEAIERSQKWFARKIDLEHDDGLRDALDRLRRSRRTYASAQARMGR